MNQSGGYDNEDEVDWGEDVSDAAVQLRMEELSDAAQKLTVSEDLEKTQQERIDLFYQFVKVCITSCLVYDPCL